MLLQQPHGTHEKSASAILAVAKRFVADISVPSAFRADYDIEYSNGLFVDFCSDLGIRHEFTALYTPQQNGPVESAISRAFKAGQVASLRARQVGLYRRCRYKFVAGVTFLGFRMLHFGS